LDTLLSGSSRSPKVRALAWQVFDTGGGSLAVNAGLQTLGATSVDSLHAKIALLGSADLVRVERFALLFEARFGVLREVIRISLPGKVCAVLIGARDHTVPASEALVGVDGHNAVFSFV
jgi:hypothetical protein